MLQKGEKMAGEKIPPEIQTLSKDEPCLISPLDRDRIKKRGVDTYLPEYSDIAFKLLSESTTAKTKSHVCKALQCSRPTLFVWMKNHPEFKTAIDDGLALGSVRFRDRIAKYAFKSSALVNNGLIKLLASNVYGIKEDADPALVINNIVSTNPEEEMKSRGIPIPSIETGDVEDE